MRVIAGTDATLPIPVYDGHGEKVQPDGDVTVTLTDAEGRGDVVADGTATDGPNGFEFDFEVPEAPLDTLKMEVAWEVAGLRLVHRDWVTVVGHRAASLYRLRSDEELRKAATPVLEAALETTETWFREAIGRPVVPEPLRSRFRVDRVDSGSHLPVPGLGDPIEVYDVTLEDEGPWQRELLGEPTIIGRSVELWRESVGAVAWPIGTYKIHLAHGMEQTPADLIRAATIMVRYLARQHNHPERAREIQSEGALIQFSIPGPERPTGLPEVDAVVHRYRTPDTSITI